MINWKYRATELALLVDRYRKEKMLSDRNLIFALATEALEDARIEDKIREKYMEWWRCRNKKKTQELYDEYLQLVKQLNRRGDEPKTN